MLIACWSPKGGSGTTVVCAGLALALAGDSPGGACLADLDGDLPALLGVAEPSGPGLSEWLLAGPDVPPEALSRLEVEVGPGLRLLPVGAADLHGPGSVGLSERAETLAARLGADPRPVIVDCGPARHGAGAVVAAAAGVSLLVLRPCYLALRRAVAAAFRPSGVVLVAGSGHALSRVDVEDVLGVPVVAQVDHDLAVARAVDAGMLARRPPRRLVRALRGAAQGLAPEQAVTA